MFSYVFISKRERFSMENEKVRLNQNANIDISEWSSERLALLIEEQYQTIMRAQGNIVFIKAILVERSNIKPEDKK